MKNSIVNLRIYKKITLFLLVGTLVGCATKNENKQATVVVENASLEDVLNENKDKTYLDEILNLNENINGNICSILTDCSALCDSEISDEVVYLSTCIKELENYIELVDKIDSLTYKNVDKLNKLDDKGKAISFTKVNDIEYINSLIEKFNSENITDVEKARCMQELQYFNSYYKSYVWHNGLAITEDLLKKALKSYACQVSGLEPKNYTNCSISGDSSAKKRTITLVDPVSGIEIKYFIDNNSGIINTVLDDLYKVQSWGSHYYDMDYSDVYDCCVPALKNVKKLIKTGVELEDNTLIPIVVKEEDAKVKSRTRA